jgi:hypothetical protein
MIDYLINLETNALITIACIALIVGMVAGLAAVAAVFEWMDRRSDPSTALRDREREKVRKGDPTSDLF